MFFFLIFLMFFLTDLPHVVLSDLLLYTDATYIVFQHKNITEIEKQLLTNFSSFWDWFIHNELSSNFSQDKTKLNIFGAKHKLGNAKDLNIIYSGTEIKHYTKEKHLGCILDQIISGESMALNVAW